MKSPLPNWLRDWLGLDPAGAGEGTVWSLSYAWPWAPGLTLVLAGLAVGLVLWLYTRERGDSRSPLRLLLASLRLGALAIALFMLAEVVLTFERTGLPPLVVLLDDSASMSIEDRSEDTTERDDQTSQVEAEGLSGPSRFNLARAWLLADDGARLKRLEREYRLQVFRMAESAEALGQQGSDLVAALRQAEPNGSASRLGDSLRGVLNELRGTPPSAVVILSDGITTEGESLSSVAVVAQRKGVPLFTVGVGSEQPVRDLKLTDLLVDEVVFVDDIVNFQAKLSAGGYPGQRIEVVLRSSGSDQVLARTQVVAAGDGQPQVVRLSYRPTEVGELSLIVEATPRSDEIETANNRQTAVVSVRREKVRVLLVQAYPNYEFRFLKNLLERDQTIELRTVLQEADPEYAESDKTALRVFPSRREALMEYDVIILGDVNPAFFSGTTLEYLTQFVEEKGGGLIVMAGPRYMPQAFSGTPLAEILPIDLGGGGSLSPPAAGDESFQVRPTELGLVTGPLELGSTPEETLAIWDQLPPLYWLLETPRLKPGTMVLAEHAARQGADGQALPVITLSYVGPGKVVFHATDETWRWRFRMGDVYFARYWVQTIRYLSRLKLLGQDRPAELTADRREYRRGDPVRLRVRFSDEREAPGADDGVTVVLETPGMPEQRLSLVRHPDHRGVFEGETTPPSLGAFHAWMATPVTKGRPATADFSVVAPPGELSRTQLDVAELSRAAELTQGHFYRLHQARNLLDDLPPGRQVPIESLPPLVLWNRWPLLLAFVLLLAAEWTLRKWRGML